MIKFYIKAIIGFILLPFFLIRYKFSKYNSARSHLSMLYAFLLTNGRVVDLIVKFKSLVKPYNSYHGDETIELPMSQQTIVHKLKTDGYCVLENAVPQKIIDEIVTSLQNLPATPRQTDNGTQLEPRIFNADASESVRYDYDSNDIINLLPVQELMASPAMINVAGQYLGTMPAADIVGVWWNTNYGNQPDSNAAQYFHFDLDRLKWLKVFVYLTDVGTDNGPHEFVRGSHLSGKMPLSIRKKIYSRISDQKIDDLYGQENRVSMTGKKGTLIFEDTRGFHKGNRVIGDPRLVLQLQFSASLFGAVYPKSRFNHIRSQKLAHLLDSEHKAILREYL